MIWFWDKYLNRSDEGKNPYASPLQDTKDCSKLPPALIIQAQFDTLYDEGLAYAKKLQAANVPVKRLSYPTFHGFTDLFNQLQIGREGLDEVVKYIVKGAK
jgi:acetyl esterase